MEIVGLIVVSYLIGSIPFGYLIARHKGVDIQSTGSGNIGMTNVWRTLGWKRGVLTFVGDVAKGFTAVSMVHVVLPEPMVGHYILAGSLAILGHFKPVWLNWKGGKVVATSLGVMLGLMPWWFIVLVLFVFGAAWGVSRQVSVGSISAALAAVLAKLTLGGGFNQQNYEMTMFIIGMSGLIIFAHRENIKRIVQGKETKF